MIKTLLTASSLLLVAMNSSANALNESQLSCLLEPSQLVEISSEVPGVIAEVSGERGRTVKKGQVLLKLSSGVERAALSLARAKVDFAKRKVKRNQDLFKKGLLSDHERDEMVTEQRVAELEVRVALERVKQRAVTSPIDAVVVKRDVSVGEYVDEKPVMTLASLNPLHAEVILRASQYGQVEEGMKVTLKAGPQHPEQQATVKYVDKVIDAASGTFGIRLELPNPELKIPAGVKCGVDFSVAKLAESQPAQ